ncbi:MAG: diguanylate cyclase [Gammaproteobacteria bacterium]
MKTPRDTALRKEQVKLLYGNLNLSLLATLMVAPLLTLALWYETRGQLLLVWLVAIVVLTLARYYLWWQFRHAEAAFSPTTWLRLFLGGVFAAGLLWGTLGVSFAPLLDWQHWFVVLFVLIGMAGGALASLSAWYPAYVAFVLPALLPMAIQIGSSDIAYNKFMSALVILFLILTTLLSRRSNQVLNKTIMLGFEREALSHSMEGQIQMVAEQHQDLLESQANLRRANDLFEAAFDSTHVMYAYLDRDFNFMRVNKAYAENNGRRPEDFVGQNHFKLFPHDDNERIFTQVRDTGQGVHLEAKVFEHPVQGASYWDWSLHPLLGSDNEVIGLLLALIDVTARKQAERVIQEKEQYLQSIMDAANEVIVTMDASGRIEMINPAVEDMFGYTQAEVLGKSASILMPEDVGAQHQRWVAGYLARGDQKLTQRMLATEARRKDGSTFPVSISVSDKMIGERHIFAAIMRDITDEQNAVDALKVKNTELQYLSSHDDLTGLHNRRTADEILQREWNRAMRAQTTMTLMMIDVDHFKNYNDRYGHQAGDICLQRVANAMQSVLNRPPDVLARYGGEEFIVILPETEPQGARQVAENLRQAVAALEIGNEGADWQQVSVSIGIASIRPRQLMNYEKLVGCADTALYQAKAQGRNCVVFSEERL